MIGMVRRRGLGPKEGKDAFAGQDCRCQLADLKPVCKGQAQRIGIGDRRKLGIEGRGGDRIAGKVQAGQFLGLRRACCNAGIQIGQPRRKRHVGIARRAKPGVSRPCTAKDDKAQKHQHRCP